MGMLDDDLAGIHADAKAMGLATAATYTTTAGVATACTVTFSEAGEPYLHGTGAEIHRRTCTLEVRRSIITSPAKGDTVTVVAGPYSGVWTVLDGGAADDGDHVLTVRLDDRTRMGTGRRLP